MVVLYYNEVSSFLRTKTMKLKNCVNNHLALGIIFYIHMTLMPSYTDYFGIDFLKSIGQLLE
jgi:hypothetical protein